jgi:hypothetical protein
MGLLYEDEMRSETERVGGWAGGQRTGWTDRGWEGGGV